MNPKERNMITPLIIMVGADKGGTGKTTVTRALLDYLDAQGIPRRVFDTEHPAGSLNRFYPAAPVVDISSVQDQMTVFDAITADAVTIVDIRAGPLSPTLRALDEVRLLDDVRKGFVKLALIHVLGPSITSLGEIAETATRIGGGVSHYLVKNHIGDAQFFEWDPAKAETYFAKLKASTISVPALKEIACEVVEADGISFAAFARNEDRRGAPAIHSRMLRGYVRAWLDAVFSEFDRVGLNTVASQSVGQRVTESRVPLRAVPEERLPFPRVGQI
jgi:hypothetical protein